MEPSVSVIFTASHESIDFASEKHQRNWSVEEEEKMSRNMKKTTTKTPFQNLKAFIILNKAFGLNSCRLVTGRLKQSSVWGYCYCVLWLLLHCVYSSIYYYEMYATSSDEKSKISFGLNIVRFSIFFISLFPYYVVAIFCVQDFIKVKWNDGEL